MEAATGQAALGIIDSQGIGLVICDVGMPDMSGIELVQVLRSRPETATLPVILMTGSGDDQTRDSRARGRSGRLPRQARPPR